MNMERLMSDLQAEQVASAKIMEKIARDAKLMEKSKVLLENIIDELSAKENVNKSKFAQLTVGGDIVTLNCCSIQQHSVENYLFALLSEKYCHLLPKDKNGRIFLDLDVRWVEPQLNWLRDMAMWSGDEISMPKLSGVQQTMTYNRGYEIISRYFKPEYHTTSSTDQIETGWLSAHSDILHNYPASNEAMRTMIPSNSGCTLTAKLLYRSSRDGLTPASFHKYCDGHKNTLCIMRDTDGGIFGGFTGDVAWKTALSGCEYVEAPNAFLFSLVHGGAFKAVKYSAKSSSSLRCYSATAIWLLAFGSNKCYEDADLHIAVNVTSCLCTGLGNGFKCDRGKFPLGSFHLAELEVFEIEFVPTTSKSISSGEKTKISETLSKLSPQQNHCNEQDKDIPSEFAPHLQCRLNVHSLIVDVIKTNEIEMQQLCDQAVSVLNKLKFVAKFVGIALPAVVHKDEEDSVSDMSELEKTLNQIQTFVKLLTVDRAETSDISDASSIVYINAGGRKIATTKAALLQAPSGSILANMASDMWGHDLDSEGNIFQDVNPDLFTTIINHLRLKALLPSSEVPPITVYEDQLNALNNLLAFYMIEDAKVEYISVSSCKHIRVK